MSPKFKTVGEYIKSFPKDVRTKLSQARKAIKEVAPKAKEGISYDIPTYWLHGKYLIYFAGHKQHIAVYPVTRKVSQALGKEIAPYRAMKGTLRFPLDKPLPVGLIKRVTKVRAKENLKQTEVAGK